MGILIIGRGHLSRLLSVLFQTHKHRQARLGVTQNELKLAGALSLNKCLYGLTIDTV